MRSLRSVCVLVALLALAGCSSATPRVTVTVPYPMASPSAEPVSEDPTEPGSNPDGVVLVASKGGVSPDCTSTTCWYVHLEWEGLEEGSHRVQCATDDLDPNVWSDNSYYFDAASGERELKCFLGHPGSEVWVVIDEAYESNRIDW